MMSHMGCVASRSLFYARIRDPGYGIQLKNTTARPVCQAGHLARCCVMFDQASLP